MEPGVKAINVSMRRKRFRIIGSWISIRAKVVIASKNLYGLRRRPVCGDVLLSREIHILEGEVIRRRCLE